jgi:hypothetical protein
MIFGPMPFLLDFFAVTMGVNHGKDENNQHGRQQNNDEGFILPDFADKFWQVGIHVWRNYTTIVPNVKNFPAGAAVPEPPSFTVVFGFSSFRRENSLGRRGTFCFIDHVR